MRPGQAANIGPLLTLLGQVRGDYLAGLYPAWTVGPMRNSPGPRRWRGQPRAVLVLMGVVLLSAGVIATPRTALAAGSMRTGSADAASSQAATEVSARCVQAREALARAESVRRVPDRAGVRKQVARTCPLYFAFARHNLALPASRDTGTVPIQSRVPAVASLVKRVGDRVAIRWGDGTSTVVGEGCPSGGVRIGRSCAVAVTHLYKTAGPVTATARTVSGRHVTGTATSNVAPASDGRTTVPEKSSTPPGAPAGTLPPAWERGALATLNAVRKKLQSGPVVSCPTLSLAAAHRAEVELLGAPAPGVSDLEVAGFRVTGGYAGIGLEGATSWEAFMDTALLANTVDLADGAMLQAGFGHATGVDGRDSWVVYVASGAGCQPEATAAP